ncbi:MAG: PepSY-associated TM helix domain-containing protein [Gammaproteobacteria bacterium]|nr:PepSY-associated TM helix domain-containing protein [Gammaproteobacteria bacterium]NVK88130.1 PepSY-associated TM helix domain-containing protein [Gammaproteobacteria bacterium]
MNRRLLISIHLYLASFFAPILLLMALSGFFYLLDIKGSVTETVVYEGAAESLTLGSDTQLSDVRALLDRLELDADVEYLRGNAKRVITRPTSKTHYLISTDDKQLVVTQREPNWIAQIIELHKGHGPYWFRLLQKVMAVGLIIIVLSGFLLGITSPALKKKSWWITASGLLVMVLLALS